VCSHALTRQAHTWHAGTSRPCGTSTQQSQQQEKELAVCQGMLS
jgi:hypothetical protein